MARDNHNDYADHDDADEVVDDAAADANETCAWTRSNVVCKGQK